MEYTDDGASESELLDPVQESQETTESDEPPVLLSYASHNTGIYSWLTVEIHNVMMSAWPRSYPPQTAWIRVCNISYSYTQANF